MRILVLSPYDDGMLDWCMRCCAAGHLVKLFSPDDKTKKCGKGLVECVNDYKEWLRWADLIVPSDNSRYIHHLDQVRKVLDGSIITPTVAGAELEIDRTLGSAFLKKHGIDTIPEKLFTNYDDAITFVKRNMKRYVSKVAGDEANKALSYVSKSPQDMVYMLERWKRAKKTGSFILQEFVPGIEMAVGGWIGPHGFNEGWCRNFEFKKFMNDDLGMNTGEQGTVVQYVKRDLLATYMLKPLEKTLVAMGYVGYIDVNCIIDEKGKAWPLEFTTRFGWPTFNIQQHLHDGDPAAWLAQLAEGVDGHPARLNEIAVGVVLTIPDYPYSHITRKEVEGVPIYGLSLEGWSKSYSPCQVSLGTAPMEQDGKILNLPCWVTAGDYVLLTVGTGSTVSSAKRSSYRSLKAIEVPNSPMYRTDIGDRLRKQLPDLQKHGFAIGMSW